MIRTKHLVEFLRVDIKEKFKNQILATEWINEIVARLERYDKLCHDLKEMIATLSSEADK